MCIELSCDFIVLRDQSHRTDEEVSISIGALLATRHLSTEEISFHMNQMCLIVQMFGEEEGVEVVYTYLRELYKEVEVDEVEIENMSLFMCYPFSLN
jgi:translation elongation factor EF-1beta